MPTWPRASRPTLADADDAVLALSDLAAADSYTLQHSLDVTALGVLIARRHFYRHGRPAATGKRRHDRVELYLVKLGVGLLLDDIGKLVVPKAILNKPGPLDDAEMADISEFARIAAVADVFDAITSERPYARAAPPRVGVRAIVEGSGAGFDPLIVESFRKVVAPFPPGCEIVLADGRRGVVVSVPQDCLELPLVRVGFDPSDKRIEPYEVDTRERPDLLRRGLAPAA